LSPGAIESAAEQKIDFSAHREFPEKCPNSLLLIEFIEFSRIHGITVTLFSTQGHKR